MIIITSSLHHVTDLEVGSEVAGDMGRVTLGEDGDLLLDVLYLVVCCLQVDDLDGHHTATALVNSATERHAVC